MGCCTVSLDRQGRQHHSLGRAPTALPYLHGSLCPRDTSPDSDRMLGRKLGLVPAAHPPCSCTCTPTTASTVPYAGCRCWNELEGAS